VIAAALLLLHVVGGAADIASSAPLVVAGRCGDHDFKGGSGSEDLLERKEAMKHKLREAFYTCSTARMIALWATGGGGL